MRRTKSVHTEPILNPILIDIGLLKIDMSLDLTNWERRVTKL